MPKTLDDLLRSLPPNVESQVRATRDRARQPIREALRVECGLSMHGRGDADDQDTRVQVPVNVVPGYPVSLRQVRFTDSMEHVLLVSRYARQLSAAATGGKALRELHRLLRLMPDGESWTLKTDEPIAQVADWAATTLRRIEQHDPVKEILKYEEDVLGIYRFADTGEDEFAPNPASIDLYWGVIGLVAQMGDYSVEDLTVVVLAHELAHAYTQLGADTDGRRWHPAAFGRAECALAEGLAQYYTERALLRLRVRFPKAHAVFSKLLTKQPEPYRAHEKWALPLAPEAVRRAMLEVRRVAKPTLAQFEGCLAKAANEIGPMPWRDTNASS